MSRTTHHIPLAWRRHPSRRTDPYTFGPSTEYYPFAREPVGNAPRGIPAPTGSMVSFHRIVELRYDAQSLTVTDSRPMPRRVESTSAVFLFSATLSGSYRWASNQAEREARARDRERLHRLAGLYRAGCPCDPDEECDGLECTDEAAIEPIRHRHSAQWDSW